MAYKIGDKFVIEIDSVMTNKNGTLYGIKGFKSMVFTDCELEQLERIPGKFEYHVGDEVVDKRKDFFTSGAITLSEGCNVNVLWKDGSVESFYRPTEDVPYKEFRKTGFVDMRIMEWVSAS